MTVAEGRFRTQCYREALHVLRRATALSAEDEALLRDLESHLAPRGTGR